jgi:surfeit locus 1 family protein
MKRGSWPLIPSIVAGAAILIMIGLGIWQLQRKGEKEAEIIQLERNFNKQAIAFPELGPVAPESLFRRSSVMCMRVEKWRGISGSDASGKPGYQYIADCVTGAEGPGALILAGVSGRPNAQGTWQGGAVHGIITREPDDRSLIGKLLGSGKVLRPMLVSTSGLGGLRAPKPPSINSIPNDHLLYAVQWFFFAFAAAVIFVLAVRKRQREARV